MQSIFIHNIHIEPHGWNVAKVQVASCAKDENGSENKRNTGLLLETLNFTETSSI